MLWSPALAVHFGPSEAEDAGRPLLHFCQQEVPLWHEGEAVRSSTHNEGEESDRVYWGVTYT